MARPTRRIRRKYRYLWYHLCGPDPFLEAMVRSVTDLGERLVFPTGSVAYRIPYTEGVRVLNRVSPPGDLLEPLYCLGKNQRFHCFRTDTYWDQNSGDPAGNIQWKPLLETPEKPAAKRRRRR